MADPEAIRAGTYWASAEDQPGHWPSLQAGQMVLVLPNEDPERVRYTVGGSASTIDREAFLGRFEFVPDGGDRRQAELARLMQEVAEAELEAEDLERELRAFNPHVSDEGALEGTGTEMVPTDPAPSPASAKKAIAEVRNRVARHKKALLGKQQRIKALLEEQQALINAKVGGLRRMVEAAEEAIWTINLYLGKEEQIVRLAEGEPAPADEKIAIRQLVLYMDEESAIAADEGGIDVRSIEAFDAWVIDPAHRQQVIPEPRAVVALKVRRSERDYGDPWITARMNEANRHTYFLMRNGENLYRIDTDLEVGRTLLPLEDEVEDLFWTDRWDPERNETIREPVRPGSRAYMEAMKKADAKRRHFMRIALFLQGLVDRTPIFEPLPAPRINLLDPGEQQKYIRLIFDAEPRRHIGTGRPPFRQWQLSINERLDVGQRVVGAFRSRTYGIHDQEDRARRLHPSNAEPPPSDRLHTIEDADGDALIIRYERTDPLDQVYDPDEGFRAPRTRASCRLYRDDRFILNFDAADVASMEFYLQSRLNRHEYRSLFPVLKRALRLKQEEAEAEAPFRTLLVGEMMKRCDAEEIEARDALEVLVPWWKFKNRTHRALTSEDAKAVRMITKEFELRRTRAAERESLDPTPVIEAVTAAHPDVVYIGHRKGPRYVALVPHNGENVFVREQEWSVGRGTPTLLKETSWRTVTSRRARWATVYTADRWDEWEKDVRARDYLTDPERARMVEMMLDRAEATCERLRTSFAVYHPGAAVCRPLVVLIDETQTLRLFVQFAAAQIPNSVVEGAPKEPGFGMVKAEWRRTRDGLEPTFSRPASLVFHRYWADENRHGHGGVGRRTTLFRDDEALAAFEEARAAHREAEVSARELKEAAGRLARQASAEVERRMEAVAYAAYLTEHGDPDLWEENKKDLELSPPPMDRVRRAALTVLAAGVDPDGWTVQQLLESAAEHGFEARDEDRDADILPLDLTLTGDPSR